MTSSRQKEDAETIAQVRQYRFNGFCLDVEKRCLFGSDNKPVKLNYRAFDTLLVLIERKGQTLSKAFLMDTVWQKTYVEDNNLNQAIGNIRKVLGDSKKESHYIKTFPGKGYCFVAQVESIFADSNDANDLPTPAGRPGILSSGIEKIIQPSSFKVFSLLALLFVATSLVIFFSWSPEQISPDADIDKLELSQLEAVPPSVTQTVIPDSVAVLPLVVVNTEAENNSLAFVFENELIKQLSKLKGVNLISKESVLVPEILQLSNAELGRILRAEHLITGTLMLNEADVLINVQMLDPQNGVIIWADTFMANRDQVSEVYAVYSEISLAIAEVLQVEVNASERQQIMSPATSSFEAYRYNLAATNAFYAQDFLKAFELSKQALALDQDYIDALTLFSKVNAVLAAIPLEGQSSQDHRQLSLEAAEQIIQLAPENPDGYLQKASMLAADSNWEGAMNEVQNLYELEIPLSYFHSIAPLLISLGNFDAAIEILEANLQVEPLNIYGRGFLLNAYESAGERMQARFEYELGEELTPIWWGDTVNVFLAMGRNEAVTNIDELYVSDIVKRVLINFENGDIDAVKAALEKYRTNPNKNSADLVYFSAFAANINDHETALEYMNQAMAEQTLNMNWFWLPVFSNTARQPAFREMLDKYGILDYWEKNGASDYVREWSQH